VAEPSADAERPWGRAWGRQEARAITNSERDAAPGETHVLGRRVVAHLLDLAICLALTVALSIRLLGSIAPQSWFAQPGSTLVWLLAAWTLNWVLLQGLTGFSVGKLVAGIRVVNHRGDSPGLAAAGIRTLPLIIEQWGIVGLLAAYRSPSRQRFGDRWAQTFVIRATPPQTWFLAAVVVTLLAVSIFVDVLG
jgi:uncharacterized RDD family membrane protein YckC